MHVRVHDLTHRRLLLEDLVVLAPLEGFVRLLRGIPRHVTNDACRGAIEGGALDADAVRAHDLLEGLLVQEPACVCVCVCLGCWESLNQCSVRVRVIE